MKKQAKTGTQASPNSAQHLASRLAKARDKKSVKATYGKLLR